MSVVLTARYSVPAGSVYNVIVTEEVLIVARPSIRVGHHMVCAGVNSGQPAEETLVCSGSVLFWSPISGHVEGVRDHQLSSVEVSAEYKRDILHPADDRSRFWSHLDKRQELYHAIYLKHKAKLHLRS